MSVKDVTPKMEELAAIQQLAAAARATILFYEPDWTDAVHLEWVQLTDNKPATTRGLADFCRESLRKAGFPHWAGDRGIREPDAMVSTQPHEAANRRER